MSSIQSIVQQAIQTGYLSLHSENQLRQLLHTTDYGVETLRAFTHLQIAVMDGQVTQQSRQHQQESAQSVRGDCHNSSSTDIMNGLERPDLHAPHCELPEVTAITDCAAQDVLLAA